MKPNRVRVTSMCELLRAAAASFIRETATSPEEDAKLRVEVDCLLTHYEVGRIDPVKEFHSVTNADTLPAASDSVPLH